MVFPWHPRDIASQLRSLHGRQHFEGLAPGAEAFAGAQRGAVADDRPRPIHGTYHRWDFWGLS